MITQRIPTSPRPRARLAFLPALGLVTVLLYASITLAGDTVSVEDGASAHALVERSSRSFDELSVDPTLRLDDYAAVFIVEPTVAFRDRWQRNQNRYDKTRVTDRDVVRIQSDMSRLLTDVLGTEFTQAGFALAEAPGNGVLVVEPAIVELDIVAPDTPNSSRSFTYSDSAGSMTLILALRDGATGRVLLSLSDRKRDPQRGFFEWRTRPYNTLIARNMMRGWAGDLLDELDEAPWLAVAR